MASERSGELSTWQWLHAWLQYRPTLSCSTRAVPRLSSLTPSACSPSMLSSRVQAAPSAAQASLCFAAGCPGADLQALGKVWQVALLQGALPAPPLLGSRLPGRTPVQQPGAALRLHLPQGLRYQ